MESEQRVTIFKERRAKHRRTQLRNYRVEIKLVGAPIYQFRVNDVSSDGAGILIKEDSKFLNLIEVGQIVDADFISPDGTDPIGEHKTEVRHITKPNEGKNKGHFLVGLKILEKIDEFDCETSQEESASEILQYRIKIGMVFRTIVDMFGILIDPFNKDNANEMVGFISGMKTCLDTIDQKIYNKKNLHAYIRCLASKEDYDLFIKSTTRFLHLDEDYVNFVENHRN